MSDKRRRRLHAMSNQELMELKTMAQGLSLSVQESINVLSLINQEIKERVVAAVGNLKKDRVKLVCSECGSDDVRADADAIWNEDLQEWELNAVYDNKTCERCNGESRELKEVPIT